MSERIALFPLRTVLFPAGVLPLRIFETRYVDMIRRCMREQAGFGVVLICTGTEAGEVASTADIGTLARIVDFSALPDGLLGVVARGERRFRIVGRALQKDGLHLADVEWLDEVPATLGAGQFKELRAILSSALAELGDAYPCGEHHLQDAQWVGSQLGQILPVSTELRQEMLEVDTAIGRLSHLDAARVQGTEH